VSELGRFGETYNVRPNLSAGDGVVSNHTEGVEGDLESREKLSET